MPKGVKIFGKKLAGLRENAHLNQSTLARQAGMSVENVKRLERHVVSATDRENIPRLASALSMSLAEFETAVVLPVGTGGDMVPIYVPRAQYEEIAANAKHQNRTVEDLVWQRCRPRVLRFIRPLDKPPAVESPAAARKRRSQPQPK